MPYGHRETLDWVIADLLNGLGHVLRGALNSAVCPAWNTLAYTAFSESASFVGRYLLGAFFQNEAFCIDGESATGVTKPGSMRRSQERGGPKRKLKGRWDMSLKWLKRATMLLTFWLSANAQASVSPGPVSLQARDGVTISGLVYEARQPKGIILLFHQAGSSKAEYATIAPKLAAAGFTALAIDQRSGGTLYGPNETVSQLGKPATYEDAKADLEAAFEWALPRHLPIILWGSSYSAALVFEVGAEHLNQVSAILAFSPGEYLDRSGAVARAARRVQVPIYVTSSSDADEVQAGREILSAAPARVKAQFVPKFGVHGSSTLIETRNPKGAAENWNHVLAFLSALPKPPG